MSRNFFRWGGVPSRQPKKYSQLISEATLSMSLFLLAIVLQNFSQWILLISKYVPYLTIIKKKSYLQLKFPQSQYTFEYIILQLNLPDFWKLLLFLVRNGNSPFLCMAYDS